MNNDLFLGGKFFAWMMLAFGGALLVGNIAAMVHRPADLEESSIERPPKRRTVTMISIGSIVTIWAVASLIAK